MWQRSSVNYFTAINICVERFWIVTVQHGHEIVTLLWDQMESVRN